jgi:histone H3/H4
MPSKPKRKQQRPAFPRTSFRKLARSIGDGIKSDLLWQKEALDALQEASEQMLEGRFSAAHDLASLCKVETLTADHLRAAAARE